MKNPFYIAGAISATIFLILLVIEYPKLIGLLIIILFCSTLIGKDKYYKR